jgi:hypothetical protein
VLVECRRAVQTVGASIELPVRTSPILHPCPFPSAKVSDVLPAILGSTHLKHAIAAVAAAALLAGCAQSPKDIAPTYVSPMLYQNLTCEQLAIEAQRVSAEAATASGRQTEKANRDAVAMGVGTIVLWPALFFVGGDQGNAAQLGALKGQMQAIEQANIMKNCGLSFDTAPAEATATPANPA